MVGATRGERDFEDDILEWLAQSGWHAHGFGRTYGGRELAQTYSRLEAYPVYDGILREKIVELNAEVTPSNADRVIDAVKDALRSRVDLLRTNQKWHRLLRQGLPVELEVNGEYRTVAVSLVDLRNPTANRFDAVSQFEFAQGRNTDRPDLVLFVNGLPLSIGEVKNVTQQKTSYRSAVRDLKEYEEEVPRLFYPCLFNFAVTQIEFRYGAPGAPEAQHFPWRPQDRDEDGEYGETGYDVEASIKSFLQPERVLQLLSHYVFYDDENSPSAKIVPRHQQFFAVKRIRERTKRVQRGDAFDPDEGASSLIWHTQGSGKSYAMYYAARYYARVRNQLSVILVDRDKLRRQMWNELSAIHPGFDVVRADSAEDLADALNGRGKVVLTTLQLFSQLEDTNDVDSLSEIRSRTDSDVFVFTDEAHRYMEKEMGSQLAATLPDAHHFGFTGTPVQEGDGIRGRNTFDNYAMPELDAEGEPYLHRYSMKRACDEGVITEVDIVSRADAFEYYIDEANLTEGQRQKFGARVDEELVELIGKATTKREVAQLDERIEAIAEDIAEHFEENVDPEGLKGMVVAPSRRAAAKYADELRTHLGDGNVEAIYTKGRNDDELLQKYHRSDEELGDITDAFADDQSPKVLVVCDMLLTGFDAPVLKTIYLDKSMQEHNLMQAIARTNRPNDGKAFGQIVDYRNIVGELKARYSEEFDRDLDVYLTEDKDDFLEAYRRKLEEAKAICHAEVDGNAEDAYPSEIANFLLRDEETTEQFKALFEDARDLREAIQPDERLRENDGLFKSLEGVYNTIRTIEEPDNGRETDEIEEKGWRDDLKDILEQSISVDRKSAPTNQRVNIDSWGTGNIRVVAKKARIEDALHEREALNPSFKSLTEQVEEIVAEWGDATIDSDTAVSKLEDIESELDDRPSPSPDEEKEWLRSVVKGVSEHRTDVDAGDMLVKVAVHTVEDEWERIRRMPREKQVKELSASLTRQILREANKPGLATSDFPDKAATYLVKNKRQFEKGDMTA